MNYGTGRIRMAEKMKGKYVGRRLSEETKQKIRTALIGRSYSEETRRKISESKRGRFTGESNPFFGKHHSEETKHRISELNKGRFSGEKNPMFGKNSMAGKSADEIRQISARKSKSLKAFYARKITDKENQS
jgi:hypothetical protein